MGSSRRLQQNYSRTQGKLRLQDDRTECVYPEIYRRFHFRDFAGAPSYSLMKEVGRIDDEVFRAACQNYVDGSMTESDGDEAELENV